MQLIMKNRIFAFFVRLVMLFVISNFVTFISFCSQWHFTDLVNMLFMNWLWKIESCIFDRLVMLFFKVGFRRSSWPDGNYVIILHSFLSELYLRFSILINIIRGWFNWSKIFSVVLFPVAVTFFITWWFIQFVDSFFSPIYARLGVEIFGKTWHGHFLGCFICFSYNILFFDLLSVKWNR